MGKKIHAHRVAMLDWIYTAIRNLDYVTVKGRRDYAYWISGKMIDKRS